jgi:hypothetical protein
MMAGSRVPAAYGSIRQPAYGSQHTSAYTSIWMSGVACLEDSVEARHYYEVLLCSHRLLKKRKQEQGKK